MQTPREGGREAGASRGLEATWPSAVGERPSASSSSGGCQGGSKREVAVVRGPTVTVTGSS